MNLIIFDKDFNNYNLVKSNKNLLQNNKNFLIDFSSINYEPLNWLSYKTVDISNLIFLEYKKNRFSLNKKIENTLSKYPIFAEYKLSEINYSDSIWRIYFEVLAIKSFVKKNKIKNIIVFTKNKKNYLSLSLSKYYTKNYFHFYCQNNFYFNYANYFKSYLIFFSNFIQELTLSFLLKYFHKKKKI